MNIFLMKFYCETKEEYTVSQNLLYRYLSSTDITKSCRIDFKRRVCSFTTRCITPDEEIFFSVIKKFLDISMNIQIQA